MTVTGRRLLFVLILAAYVINTCTCNNDDNEATSTNLVPGKNQPNSAAEDTNSTGDRCSREKSMSCTDVASSPSRDHRMKRSGGDFLNLSAEEDESGMSKGTEISDESQTSGSKMAEEADASNWIVKRGRPLNGFLGMRGKKDYEKKPDSKAFYGMRGKKDQLDGYYDDQEVVDDASAAKRAPSSPFYGMRGRKSDEDAANGKRRPNDVFLGMRGKKQFHALRGKKVFVPSRGKKPKFQDTFFGLRGKKDGDDGLNLDESYSSSSEIADDNVTDKRGNVKNFFGMRGKRNGAPMTSLPRFARQAAVSRTGNNYLDGGTFYHELLQSLTRPRLSYADGKRQIGRIFIGMRG